MAAGPTPVMRVVSSNVRIAQHVLSVIVTCLALKPSKRAEREGRK